MRTFVATLALICGLAFAEDARAWEQHKNTDGSTCFGVEVDADKPCYDSAAGYNCVQPTNYDTCVEYCECGLEENKDKCDGGLLCTDIAMSEYNACLGGCLSDW